MSTTGDDGTELSSTVVGKRAAAALDSSDMLLGKEIEKENLELLKSKLFQIILPDRISCAQWTMMMLWLIRTPHRHASQKLLKTAARLSLSRCWKSVCVISACHNSGLHGRWRGDISCHWRMVQILCRLPGLRTRTQFRWRWWWRDCSTNQISLVNTALCVAAATSG